MESGRINTKRNLNIPMHRKFCFYLLNIWELVIAPADRDGLAIVKSREKLTLADNELHMPSPY